MSRPALVEVEPGELARCAAALRRYSVEVDEAAVRIADLAGRLPPPSPVPGPVSGPVPGPAGGATAAGPCPQRAAEGARAAIALAATGPAGAEAASRRLAALADRVAQAARAYGAVERTVERAVDRAVDRDVAGAAAGRGASGAR